MSLYTDNEVMALIGQYAGKGDLVLEEIYVFAVALRDAVEKKSYEASIEGVWNEAIPWQEETFPQATIESITAHLREEAREFASEPSDQKEAADIALLLGHWCHKTKTNLWAVMREKLRVNKARQWGKPNEEGYVEHIRGEEPQKHYMKVDSSGYPYGIGHTEKKWRSISAHYERGEDGQYTGRKALFQEEGGIDFLWMEIEKSAPSLWTTKDREVLFDVAKRQGRTIVLDEQYKDL